MLLLETSPSDWVAMAGGPVFAICVASYLLTRVDKTLGEIRDTMRDVSRGVESLPAEDTIRTAVRDGVYSGLQEHRIRGGSDPSSSHT